MDNGWEAQQVILGVARCSDRSDLATMMQHFAEQAVLVVGDRRVEGRDAIFEFFGGAAATIVEKERTKHVITNTLVAEEGDDLVTTSYFQVLRSWGIANWGRYHDRLARRDGRLQIIQRQVEVDGQIARPTPPAATSA
jgi:3-phenylpropionate/cinnamic acid dioxygenase small subunit